MEDQITVKPGQCRCLKCERFFKSRDIKTNRVCQKCKNTRPHLSDIATQSACERVARRCV